eukprot:TRINITY_DN75560_c0_g1_i1.p1 TRINITY_DN75560_c0_g1~~TRINITY_DN75560_c0_g1_i1.p1  ORF type:complete len:324 (+),score=52.94 TRINITY_DN75560_c0_g1_i1:290-1261(+)
MEGWVMENSEPVNAARNGDTNAKASFKTSKPCQANNILAAVLTNREAPSSELAHTCEPTTYRSATIYSAAKYPNGSKVAVANVGSGRNVTGSARIFSGRTPTEAVAEVVELIVRFPRQSKQTVSIPVVASPTRLDLRFRGAVMPPSLGFLALPKRLVPGPAAAAAAKRVIITADSGAPANVRIQAPPAMCSFSRQLPLKKSGVVKSVSLAARRADEAAANAAATAGGISRDAALEQDARRSNFDKDGRQHLVQTPQDILAEPRKKHCCLRTTAFSPVSSEIASIIEDEASEKFDAKRSQNCWRELQRQTNSRLMGGPPFIGSP